MKNISKTKDELAKKIQQCLIDANIQAEIEYSEHEATVFGRIEIEGQTLKVVAHLSDRDVIPANHGSILPEIARSRLANAYIRPTLANRAATSTYTPPEQTRKIK